MEEPGERFRVSGGARDPRGREGGSGARRRGERLPPGGGNAAPCDTRPGAARDSSPRREARRERPARGKAAARPGSVTQQRSAFRSWEVSPCRTTWERTSARPRRRRRRTNPSAVSGGRGAERSRAAVGRGDPGQQRHKRRCGLGTSFCLVFMIGDLSLSCLVSALDEGDIALLKTYVSNARPLLTALGAAEAAPRVLRAAVGQRC